MAKDYKNTIDYVKNSSFYNEARYHWLKSLIDEVFMDSLQEKSIRRTINKHLSIKEENDEVEVAENIAEEIDEQTGTVGADSFEVKKIKSIESISNIGLLEINEPIPLNDRLNIFYGKNAGGKSSIFLALCKALGIEKNVYSNINTTNDRSSCLIKILDETDNEKVISWQTGDVNEPRETMVFDSQISNYLVEYDQINEFQLAHLKSEYFSFLHSMFDKVSKELQSRFSNATNEKDPLMIKIEVTLPDFFEEEKEITKEQFDMLTLTEKEKQRIGEIDGQLKMLGQADTSAVIKNLSIALQQTNNVLQLLGFEKVIETDDEEEAETKKQWTLKYTGENFKKINEKIRFYRKAKEAFTKSKGKLTELVPENWISKEMWDRFIESGVEFIQSLEEVEKKKYTEENCAFCHQPLETNEAKELIKIYQEIQEEHQQNLKESVKGFSEISVALNTTITGLSNLSKWNKLIEAEFPNIGREGKIDIDLGDLNNVFNTVKNGMDIISEFTITDENKNTIENFWNYYFKLFKKFNETIESLNSALKDKKKKIEDLTKEVKPLRYRRDLLANKENILKYFEWKNQIDKIKDCEVDITAIRQNTSRLETTFSKEEPLKLFENYLQKEYKDFNFTPPPVWNISASTRDGENKRIYRLGDKRLAEIFSESERKIHALADFFAESAMNNYKGVYIFDDPVNSLDEERMEYVSNRILQLVVDGNQVIVFTHNLFFMNFLVDTEKETINRISRLTTQILVESNLKMDKELKERYDEMQKRINGLAGKDENEISKFELRNIYDLMSGYLESYVEVKILKNVINRYRPNIRMHSLDRLKQFDVSIIDDVIKLYKQTSRKGSRHSQPTGTPPPKYSALVNHFQELQQNFKYN